MELILHGGTIRTLDPHRPVVDALGIDDGRVVARGSDEISRAEILRSETIDLAGRTALPAFHDAHVHPVAGGLAHLGCDLSGVHGLDEYRRLLSAFACAHPDQSWVQGGGWYGDAFEGGFPDRHLLDEYFPDRPATFSSHDLHSLWVNTRALELAGIDRDTPDPPGGVIQRTSEGEPSGLLLETAAQLVTSRMPDVTDADIEGALLAAQEYLHRLGVVSWQDALVGRFGVIPDAFEAYLRLARSGRLASGARLALWLDPNEDVDEQIEIFERRRNVARGAGDGRLEVGAVKILLDGVCENFTGALLDPYVGRGGFRGEVAVSPSELRRIVRDVDSRGFAAHIHAVGDRAVRDALDAILALPQGGREPLHQIAHLDLVAPEDAERMGRAGVIAAVQPLWARRDPVLVETKLPYLTDNQRARHFAFRTLHEAGAPLVFSSDWPVSSPDPIWGMHVAVNRTAPPGDPHAQDAEAQSRPLLSEESVSVEAAVAGYTTQAARAVGRGDSSGCLTIGRDADVVVLDGDPFAVPSRAIGEIVVEMTLSAGAVVHSR